MSCSVKLNIEVPLILVILSIIKERLKSHAHCSAELIM